MSVDIHHTLVCTGKVQKSKISAQEIVKLPDILQIALLLYIDIELINLKPRNLLFTLTHLNIFTKYKIRHHYCMTTSILTEIFYGYIL